MRNRFRLLTHRARPLGLAGTLALAAAAPGWAANVPAGTLITGSVTGATSGVLGLDSAFTPGPGANVTALAATDLEFLSDDFAVGIDFFTDGLVRVYDNTGTGLVSGSYSFSFDFAALPAAFTAFALADVTGLSGGSVNVSRVDGDTLRITMNNAAFSTAFGSFSAQAQTATVPEPGSLALAAAALALMSTRLAGPSRRRAPGAATLPAGSAA